jgi:hypothetical protein
MKGEIGCTVLRKPKDTEWFCTTKNWVHFTLLDTLTWTLTPTIIPRYYLERI